MTFAIKYTLAYILDLIFGDPYWFPHPVRIIGYLISFLEKLLYRFKNRKIFGGVLVLIVLSAAFSASFLISAASEYLEIFFLYTTLATKSLGNEGIKVYKILKEGNLEKAKKELSYLVSRDTQDMDITQIVRSTLETLSENSVDGIIAPMFYAFLGSFFYIEGVSLALPFAMTYKAVNTMDSMLGYKNEKYIDFGMAAAKTDDFFNLVPARIAGALLIPVSAALLRYDFKSSFKIFLRDRKNHSSPNSGHPEAAFAGALGVQFGGRTSYFGNICEKPTIGNRFEEFDTVHILKAYKLLYASSFISFLTFILIRR